MNELPSPPRVLQRRLLRNLWWGRVPLLACVTNLFLCQLLFLLLCLLYGISFQSLLAPWRESVEVESALSRIDSETLPSGGQVRFAATGVKVNGRVLEVRGYGPATARAKPGQPVRIFIPTSQPGLARLGGFQAHPVRPGTLLEIALLLALPGMVVGLYSMRKSHREVRLLRHGKESEGRKVRAIPLVRPLKEKELARWEFDSEGGGARRFWSLQKTGYEENSLLVRGDIAAVKKVLTEGIELDGEELRSASRTRDVLFGLVLFQLVCSALMWFFFVLV